MTTMNKCRNGHEKPKARPCPICSAARNAAFAADPTDPRHGTQNGYANLRCRCDSCTAGWRLYYAAWVKADPRRGERHRVRERVRTGWVPAPEGHLTATQVAAAVRFHVSNVARAFEPSVVVNSRNYYAPADLHRQVQEKIDAKWGGILSLLEEWL